MGVLRKTAFDESQVTKESRLFAARFFTRFPDLRRYAAMELGAGSEAWSLVLTVPAPSGDPRAELVVWLEGGDDLSVAFGAWHTHEDVWGEGADDDTEALLDLVAGILTDRFVICEDVDDAEGFSATILDLSVEDALLEELTSQHSPGRARLRSWSGRLDREITLEDLERGEPV